MIDASAFLAVAFQEPGADFVRPRLAAALLSVVNYQEVIEKMQDRKLATSQAWSGMQAMQIQLVEYTLHQSELAALMKPVCRPRNISFADRACLALAQERALPVLTADRSWASVELGVRVELIR